MTQGRHRHRDCRRGLAEAVVEQPTGTAEQGDTRADSCGGHLPQPARRLVGAVLAEQHDEWGKPAATSPYATTSASTPCRRQECCRQRCPNGSGLPGAVSWRPSDAPHPGQSSRVSSQQQKGWRTHTTLRDSTNPGFVLPPLSVIFLAGIRDGRRPWTVWGCPGTNSLLAPYGHRGCPAILRTQDSDFRSAVELMPLALLPSGIIQIAKSSPNPARSSPPPALFPLS